MNSDLTNKRPYNNQIKDNLMVKSDDLRFVDGAQGNYTLNSGADTGIPGFQPIPFSNIGRQIVKSITTELPTEQSK